MSVNGITNATQAYDTKSMAKTKTNQSQNSEETKQKATDNKAVADNTAAVYEKGTQTDNKKIYQRDPATVEKMMAEANRRTQALRELVEKLLTKQGQTFNDANDIYSYLREGKVKVDPETRAQAQKDIAEDGYWGVEQTSERMLSFAKALAGSDPTKADEMINAVKKGFEQAKKAWGGALPDISQRTLDATISKLEAWRDGKDDSGSMKNAAANALTDQAAKTKLAE